MEGLKEGKIYLCTVKKLLQHGVIVSISDTNIDGFIHISELSKRWVKDIKDVAKEGDKLVCKLIKADEQSPELSIKRVTDNERKQVLKEWSIEGRITKLLSGFYPKDLNSVKKTIIDKYGSLYGMYELLAEGKENSLEPLKLKKEAADALLDFVEKTKKKITIKTELEVMSLDGYGVDKIKEFLTAPYINKKEYSIKYIKAPHYMLLVNAGDTKKTLTQNRKLIDAMQKKSDELGLEFKYKEIKE